MFWLLIFFRFLSKPITGLFNLISSLRLVIFATPHPCNKPWQSCSKRHRLVYYHVLNNALKFVNFSNKTGIYYVLYRSLKACSCKNTLFLSSDACSGYPLYTAISCHDISKKHYVSYVNVNSLFSYHTIRLLNYCSPCSLYPKNICNLKYIVCSHSVNFSFFKCKRRLQV